MNSFLKIFKIIFIIILAFYVFFSLLIYFKLIPYSTDLAYQNPADKSFIVNGVIDVESFYNLAIKNKDTSVCRKLTAGAHLMGTTDGMLRAACYEKYVRAYPEEDYLCAPLKQMEIKRYLNTGYEQCRSFQLESLSVKTSDYSLCNKNEDINLTNLCLLRYSYYKKDAKVCSLISNDNLKKECINNLKKTNTTTQAN